MPAASSTNGLRLGSHSANVAHDGKGDLRGTVAVQGKLPRTHDLCEEDHHANVGSGDVAEDDTENTDKPVAP